MRYLILNLVVIILLHNFCFKICYSNVCHPKRPYAGCYVCAW